MIALSITPSGTLYCAPIVLYRCATEVKILLYFSVASTPAPVRAAIKASLSICPSSPILTFKSLYMLGCCALNSASAALEM